MSDEFRIEDYKEANPACPKCGMYNCKGDCAHDTVSHPPHYTYGKIECIDFICDKKLNFNLGNAIKYIVRADHKGSKRQDLEKAIQYLNFEIEKGGV